MTSIGRRAIEIFNVRSCLFCLIFELTLVMIVVGAYSSIFVPGPIVYIWPSQKKPTRKGLRPAGSAPRLEPKQRTLLNRFSERI